jgi:NAD(P)H-dependent flavin oxidoreductase YrpB (nitropropane dioxygenase family)
MITTRHAMARAEAFCTASGIGAPILLAPMAGSCPPSLSIAVANAGGLGTCGALLMQPDAIKKWAAEVRANNNGGFQINLWVPDPNACLLRSPRSQHSKRLRARRHGARTLRCRRPTQCNAD